MVCDVKAVVVLAVVVLADVVVVDVVFAVEAVVVVLFCVVAGTVCFVVRTVVFSVTAAEAFSVCVTDEVLAVLMPVTVVSVLLEAEVPVVLDTAGLVDDVSVMTVVSVVSLAADVLTTSVSMGICGSFSLCFKKFSPTTPAMKQQAKTGAVRIIILRRTSFFLRYSSRLESTL